MKDYKAYIFDMDLTLLNTLESAFLSYSKGYEAVGLKFDEKTLTHHLSIPLTSTYEEMGENKGKFEDFYEAFKQTSRETFLMSKIYDDALIYIKYLYNKGKKIGIVTNRESRNVFAITDREGITNLFTSVVTSDRLSILKPNPDPILKALQELDVNPDEAIYFGDAKNDYIASKSANVDFICIERYHNCDFECDVIINSFDELIK